MDSCTQTMIYIHYLPHETRPSRTTKHGSCARDNVVTHSSVFTPITVLILITITPHGNVALISSRGLNVATLSHLWQHLSCSASVSQHSNRTLSVSSNSLGLLTLVPGTSAGSSALITSSLLWRKLQHDSSTAQAGT